MIRANLSAMKSENLGGLVSMLGSSLFLLGGTTEDVTVTVCFVAAELVLAARGHERRGYSIGCALFATGDALAVISTIAAANMPFQITLGALAAVWSMGAVRAPLASLGAISGRPRLVAVADTLQLVVGVGALALRLPGLVSAFAGGNFIGAFAISCWAISDILVGRLRRLARQLGHWRRRR